MRPLPPRRSSKDYLLPFFIIISLGVIATLLVQLWGMWGDDGENSLGLSGKAELTEISGDVEVFLPAASAWKITSEAANLNPGESVRTGADSSAVLSFDDGSVIALASSSEVEITDLQNSITKKSVKLTLVRGTTAVMVGTMHADFEITSEFLKIHDTDGQFLLQIDGSENIASAIDGGFVATVLDPQNEKASELKNFVVEGGETIEISERRVNLLRIGGEIDVVKATLKEILNSDFYLATTNKSNEDAENEDINPDETTTDAERDVLPAPFITTGGGNISAVDEPVKVSGKVSPKIVKVEVMFENEAAFALSQFEANSGDWSYNASRDFGNLNIGVNNYTIIGYDEAGGVTPTANFQIRFNPEGVEEEPEVVENEDSEVLTETETTTETDGVPTIGETTFAAPTVSEPTDGATITTTPVHFAGTVPAGTKEVLVNEYKLSSFTTGDTTWRYNASPDYENLEEGENEYEIVAMNEAGDRSSVVIKIVYNPEEE